MPLQRSSRFCPDWWITYSMLEAFSLANRCPACLPASCSGCPTQVMALEAAMSASVQPALTSTTGIPASAAEASVAFITDGAWSETMIPLTFAFAVETGATPHPLLERPAASPVGDCEWQRRLGDLMFELDGAPSARALAAYNRALGAPAGCLLAGDEAKLAAWLGAIALGAGRAAEALPLLERALAHGDVELTTFTNRAVALEVLGRTRDAAAAWDAVIARAGESELTSHARSRRARLLGE